ASPEYSVIVSYVETISELPWSKLSQDNLDLDQAQKILDRDHYDLAKVKRRLIEYLAVRKLNPRGHGPILCFLGPPGVGKTSLGQSIDDALRRRFVRMSLWYPGRGGDSRASPDLHCFNARPHHSR